MISKFVFDRIAAFLGCLFLLPFMLLIGLVVKLSNPRSSIIYRQKRVGRGGSCFTMFKFRTMYETGNTSTVTVGGEARITPVGAFLRRYKIDELPELWNVLIGDMSFVGPRPDVPGYADKLEGENRRILELRPGITGPASIKYRNEEELLAMQSNPQKFNDEVIFPDKVRINLNYLYHWRFLLDMKLIFITIFGGDLKR